MNHRTSVTTGTIRTCLSDNYHLGAGYCRQYLRKGGVSIFVHGDLKLSKININEFCKEQHIKACAIKKNHPFSSTVEAAYYNRG
jgi:hypothetical protein